MNNTTSLRPIISELEELFKLLNNRFYQGQLVSPVITISPDTTKGSYGWCTTWKAWSRADDPDITSGHYEINICSEHIARDPAAVAGTLLHEMAHLYNLQNNIKDCSRGGTYHNKRFKVTAEAHGLLVSETDKYGWAVTELTPEAESYVREHVSQFSLQRRKLQKVTGKKKKQSSRKYVCPGCGIIVRATKEVRIICYDCGMMLELEAPEEDSEEE